MWVERRRKGNGKVYRAPTRWYHRGVDLTRVDPEERGKLVQCDGTVKVLLRAVDEPDWGYTYAKLEIKYRCETCGATVFPHLPNSAESLSTFVTDKIAEM